MFAKVHVNKEDLSADILKGCDLLIIGCPQAQFMDGEFQVLKDFIDRGGSVAVFSSEGGDYDSKSNLNGFLIEYGITIDRTSVVRAVYHKYLHPKHALINNGIVQPEIGDEKETPLILNTNTSSGLDNYANGRMLKQRMKPQDDRTTSLSFVYPNGTTISVQAPAYTLLSSGSTSYPVDCPIAAAWESSNFIGKHATGDNQGRLLVIGSSDMFADDWLEKEENSRLCDVLLRFLLRQNVSFDPSQGRSDFEEKECVPDISSLSNLIKPCLQDNEPLPQDYKTLLCKNLFGMDNDSIPDVIDLYKRLNIPYEPLTLVRPHFECPHPPLQMTAHPPHMIDPPSPALELFDLDECFSDVRIRLSQLTNQFSDDTDLDHYIQEASWIIGLDSQGLDQTKLVLYNVCRQVSSNSNTCKFHVQSIFVQIH